VGYLAELKKNLNVPDDGPKKPKEPGKVSCLGSFGSSSGVLEKIHIANSCDRQPVPLADRDPSEAPAASAAEVRASYPDARAAEPFESIAVRESEPIAGDQDAAIRAWLAQIGETDATTIDEVLTRCRNDSDARACYLGRARHAATDDLDDRRACRQCCNLRSGVCIVAKPGGIVSATRGYRPAAPELPRRCDGYAP